MSAESRDDFTLMEAIANGDRQALSALYDRHSPLLFSICRHVLQDTGEAEDVLIDVFFEVWSRAERFEAARGCPLTYLVTLARSRAIDRRRSQTARPRMMSDDARAEAKAASAENPLQAVDSGEQREIVRAAMGSLEPAQREALECSFYEGLSHSEIAAKLGKPLGTVKTHIRQGLIRLRDRLRSNQ